MSARLYDIDGQLIARGRDHRSMVTLVTGEVVPHWLVMDRATILRVAREQAALRRRAGEPAMSKRKMRRMASRLAGKRVRYGG